MIQQEAKDFWPLIKQWSEGGTMQNLSADGKVWLDIESVSLTCPSYYYRIKPSSTYRPWKPEEVPLGAWIRPKSDHKSISLIFSVSEYGLDLPDTNTGKLMRQTLKFFLCKGEHSTDQGKTWRPCGVLES